MFIMEIPVVLGFDTILQSFHKKSANKTSNPFFRLPAKVTLFKTIIKVKDRQNFKDKFLEEPYSTETISETFEPAPVLLRLQGLTLVLNFI